MKKTTRFIALLTALLMLCCLAPAAAAEPTEAGKTVLTIGTVTPLEGNLYGKMWGLNTTDIDLRLLLHGAGTVTSTRNYRYALNNTVLENCQIVEESDGSRSYVFTLRPGLKYSDGSDIKAADYVFTVLLQSSPLIKALGGDNSRYASLLGFDAYAAGDSAEFQGLRLLGEDRFSLTISPKALPFFYELTAVDVTPTPIDQVAPGCRVLQAENGRGAYLEGAFTQTLLEETLLGEKGYERRPGVVSGPYTLTEIDPDRHTAVFTRNPYYAGDGSGRKPVIDEIRIVPVTSENMAQLLESGQVDVVHKISSLESIQAVQRLAQKGQMRTVRYPRAGYGYVSFNCEQPTVASESVRKAVAYSLDKDKLVKDFGGSYADRVYGMYGRAQWMTTFRSVHKDITENEDVFDAAAELRRLPRYSFDLNKAASLLAEDGWTLDTDGNPWTEGKTRAKMIDGVLTPLVIRFGQSEGSVPAALVAEQLAENLPKIGAELKVTMLDFNEMLRMVYRQADRSDYDMFVLASNFDYLFDPYYMFHTNEAYDGTLNTTALHDPELMALALEMRQTLPNHDELYVRRWVAFQRAWADTLPTIPLYSNDNVDCLSRNLQGWTADSMNSWASGIANVYFR